MNRKIFRFSFLVLSVFVFGSLNVSIVFAARKASVTISPTTAFVEEDLTYNYVVTNTNDEETTAKIGAIEIVVPSEFGIPSVSILSVSADKAWMMDSSEDNYAIRVKADGAGNKLDIDESIEIQIIATAPALSGTYEWIASVFANLDFTSNPPFTLSSEQPTVDVAERPTVTFIIRNGDIVLHNNSVTLPPAGTISISGSDGVPRDVDAQSVLAVLKAIDEASDAFSISNLQYFDSFGSFYLKCILPEDGEDLCDNWQYAVGNVTPFSGIDAAVLSGGETVGIYFGTTHQLVLSANAITVGGSLDATAEKYDYENNIWNPLTNASVGVTLPNPDDPWSPIVVSTHSVDELGNANITITEAGTYTLGIVEDFYFPSYTVAVSPLPSGGGVLSGGGGGGNSAPAFSVANAISYLESAQGADGSFGGALLYTDWAAIAFGAGNVTGNPRDTLLDYFNSHNALSSLLTDNERRAMALLALGENPYDFNGVNYIGVITSSFDGAQFGDTSLINDDIFALIPLASAGYTASDEIIAKSIAFIISKQNIDGSWENSVDITAAALAALKSFESAAGVADAVTKGSAFLQNAQGNDGGWGNVFSTSWAMQAESALNTTWTKNNLTGDDFLAPAQATDGAVSPTDETLTNRIWATSYAIPAVLGKPWSAIMQSVSKPASGGPSNNSVSLSLSSANSQAVITSQTQTVNILVVNGTADGNVNISSLISLGTGNIPKMNITSSQNILVNIPATNITSADPNWNGILALPKTTTVTLPETAGELKTVSVAIEVGSDNKLSFNNAARILFPGEAGKKIGFSRTGTNFTEIANTCSGDTQTANDTLPTDGDCKIDAGSDLVIWTKHFTTFATYTTAPVAGNTGGGGGGGGGGVGPAPLLTSQNNAGDSADTLAENNISLVETGDTSLTESDSAVANTSVVRSKFTSTALANKSKSIAPELSKDNDTGLEIISDTLTASAVEALPQEKAGKTIPIIPVAVGVLSGAVALFFLRKFLLI